MPTRLSASRPRAPSRPPAPQSPNLSQSQNQNQRQPAKGAKHSSQGHAVTLDDVPDDEDDEEWEPQPNRDEEPLMTLEEIRLCTKDWEQDLRTRGRQISGRTIVVVHSLPYVCTLHPAAAENSHSTSFDRDILPKSTDQTLIVETTGVNHTATANHDDGGEGSGGGGQMTEGSASFLNPTYTLNRTASPVSSGAVTPLEIQPGDPLLRPRALHSPTTQARSSFINSSNSNSKSNSNGNCKSISATAPTSKSSSSASSAVSATALPSSKPPTTPSKGGDHPPPNPRRLPVVGHFKDPSSSLKPSFHPPCPPSRAPSPDSYLTGGEGGSISGTGLNGGAPPIPIPIPAFSSSALLLSRSGDTITKPKTDAEPTVVGVNRGGGPNPIKHEEKEEDDSYSDVRRQGHRWILHPRRGHAALNSGLKSLSGSPLTVVGRPDDLLRAGPPRHESQHQQYHNYNHTSSNGAGGGTGSTHTTTNNHNNNNNTGTNALGIGTGYAVGCEVLGQAELGDVEKKDLEAGLLSMAGEQQEGIGCVPVWLDDKVHYHFYEGMCKTYLWPIFHYLALPDSLDKKSEEEAWNAYYETNLVYATKVAQTYRPGDLIWVHDYHLLLVPKMLRTLLPNASLYISLFLHCPFPSSEYFRCLPRREAILDGMLGCNLVCFQTHSYARHFLSSCVRVMGYEAGSGGVDARGSITRIAHCPIGIDVENVELDRASPGVLPKVEALRKMYEGKKIIVGRDKLDPTKGVLPKLRAFERFLATYPQWQNNVVLIQVTSPSSGDSAALATKVSELVDHINGLYGSLEFQPVHHYHQTIERDEYFALLTVADVALITSIRDGMNTTSMEYIICQAEAKGSLIVSEFTGVSALLNKAIKVNPWDLGGVSRAIDTCLKMPLTERKQRHSILYDRVMSHTASVWAATNILKLLESLQGEQASQNTPPLDEKTLLTKYEQANKRLLLFDYDGTLTPIVKEPSAAVPSQSLLKSLTQLTRDPKNIVYIISGRDGEFLEEHLGHIENLGMSAEHGCFIRGPGAKKWISLTEDLDMDWKTDVMRIFKYYEARTQGAFVEKKVSSVTFHYRNADPVFGLFQAKECQAMLESMQESLPIDVLVGKKNVEVRPAHTNKGEIVQRLLYMYPETEFCMCAGDDKTDEDMFHSMARIFSAALPGGLPIITPPESLLLFPSLALELKKEKHEDESVELEPVESSLKLDSMYMIAIEARETQGARMTMANAVLNTVQAMLNLLSDMAKIV